MKIDDALISKLERLSRLELASDERELIKADLNSILKMVDTLEELDTTDVDPLIYMNGDKKSVREDIVAHELSHEAAMVNAPLSSETGHFLVPKVMDK